MGVGAGADEDEDELEDELDDELSLRPQAASSAVIISSGRNSRRKRFRFIISIPVGGPYPCTRLRPEGVFRPALAEMPPKSLTDSPGRSIRAMTTNLA